MNASKSSPLVPKEADPNHADTRGQGFDTVNAEILKAVRELRFGVVEVVVHQGKVTEIRKTTRLRFEPNPTPSI